MRKLMAMMMLVMMGIGHIAAQSTDKRLIGVWMMETIQFEGEEKIICDKEYGYGQFKYYGADGEYACAQIFRQKDGRIIIAPHEYGTYIYKNGVYSEMGRPAGEPDALILVDEETFKGRFFNRHDVWKKAKMPKEVVDYIVNYCKMVKQGPPEEMQKLIEKSMFAE